MGKVGRTPEELEKLLSEQLAFVRSSAESYDRGNWGEAKRLAHSLRVLLHDTATSHSLLGQLGRKGGLFVDTALPRQPGNKLTYSGLVMMGIGGRDGGRYLAMGSGVPEARRLPFDPWWNQTVFIDNHGHELRRRDVVLTAANQDGGSHVDPALDETYARLLRDNSMGWVKGTPSGEEPMPEPIRATIRQITHELERSLRADFSWEPEFEVGMYAGGAAVFDAPSPPLPHPDVSRNARCPCGSGKRFKNCHGRSHRAA